MLCFAIILLSACSWTPLLLPTYLAPGFTFSDVHRVHLLPILDLRKDKSVKINIQNVIVTQVVKSLNKRGYEVILGGNFFQNIPNADQLIHNVDIIDVRELVHVDLTDASYLLIISLDDLSTKLGLSGYTVKIEISGVLINKKDGTVLWRDKEVSSEGRRGILSAILSSLKKDTIRGSIKTMIASWPQK